MTTNDDRRGMAARLRGLETAEFDEDALGLATDDGEWYGARGVRRLADLIDRPTCEDVSVPHGDGFTPYVEFKCSACGCSHISLAYVYYCPNCGAEVTRNG